MKLRFPHKKLLALVIAGLCVLAAIVWTIIAKYTLNPFNPVGDVIPMLGNCDTVRLPEYVPSSGLAWSRETYPDQYAPDNYASVELKGLPDRINERFMDVGGHGYSREFLSHFSYTDAAIGLPKVKIEYLPQAETFTGRVIASGLKPHFAYQLKLRGIFADREAFENIGHTGRWRLPGRGTNYTDTDYANYPAKNLVESYLLFDFLVTDAQGNINREFYADSSLHVLWNLTTQRRRPGVKDSVPVRIFLKKGDLKFYANPNPNFYSHEIYAEQEGNARKPIGSAFLPPGKYTAEIVLTEESFHGYGDSGFWPTVMYTIVKFEVLDKARPASSRVWSDGCPEAQPVPLDKVTLIGMSCDVAAPNLFVGSVTGTEPSVTVERTLELPEGARYFLGFDALVRPGAAWKLVVDTGLGFEEGRTYQASSQGCRGWRRFEVEVTSAVAGKKARLQFSPGALDLGLSLRNLAVYRISE